MSMPDYKRLTGVLGILCALLAFFCVNYYPSDTKQESGSRLDGMRKSFRDTRLLLLTVVGFTPYNIDRTHGQSSVCELHQAQMAKTNVPIRYGLIGFNTWGKALEAARSNTFPHAAEEILGGCIVGDPTNAIFFVCPICLTARSSWEVQHPHP
jgi:hypothetical protein